MIKIVKKKNLNLKENQSIQNELKKVDQKDRRKLNNKCYINNGWCKCKCSNKVCKEWIHKCMECLCQDNHLEWIKWEDKWEVCNKWDMDNNIQECFIMENSKWKCKMHGKHNK